MQKENQHTSETSLNNAKTKTDYKQNNINKANLSVISSVQCHPMLPEMFEEIW